MSFSEIADELIAGVMGVSDEHENMKEDIVNRSDDDDIDDGGGVADHANEIENPELRERILEMRNRQK